MSKSSNPPPIAVVGVSALFPGSVDGRGFWRDILEGRDLIREVPESHLRGDLIVRYMHVSFALFSPYRIAALHLE